MAPASAGSSGGGSGGAASGGAGPAAARPPEAMAAAADAAKDSTSEWAGGSGLRLGSFKSAKSDAADAVDAALSTGEPAKLDENGNREPASDENANNDILSQDSESIFLRVRSKYGMLKGAGRI